MLLFIYLEVKLYFKLILLGHLIIKNKGNCEIATN